MTSGSSTRERTGPKGTGARGWVGGLDAMGTGMIRCRPGFWEAPMRAKFLLVSAGLSTLLVTASAFADPPGAAPAPAPAITKIDPKAKGGSPYNAKLTKGNAAYAAKDYQGAIAAYKEAVAADANDALA